MSHLDDRVDHVVIDLDEAAQSVLDLDGVSRDELSVPDIPVSDGGLPDSGVRSPRHWRLIARSVDLLVAAGVCLLVFGTGRPLAETAQVTAAVVAVAALRLGVAKRRTMSIGKARTVETMEVAAVSFEIGVALLVLDALLPLTIHPGRIVACSGGLVLGWAVGRRLTRAVIRRLPAGWTTPQRVVLVGDNEEAAWLHRLMADNPHLALTVVGRVGHPLDAHSGLSGLPWLGTLNQIGHVTQSVGATSVVVATTGVRSEELSQVVRELQSQQLELHVSAGLRGVGRGSVRLSTLGFGAMVRVTHTRRRSWQVAVKRIVDVVGASLALVIASPVLALTALALLREGDGPVLFRQERAGKDGSTFVLFKFRSMVCDAEERLADLAAKNERSGPLFKMQDDPRVTRLGRFLRASSIDELPQLVNVIRGEMSLVGPRPALLSEAAKFSGRLADRNQVLPGITGLWQVEARDNPSFFSYERLDLYYIDNWSVRLDLAIVVTTVPVVLQRALRSVIDSRRLRAHRRSLVLEPLDGRAAA